jgi:hypothetical protein
MTRQASLRKTDAMEIVLERRSGLRSSEKELPERRPTHSVTKILLRRRLGGPQSWSEHRARGILWT